MKNLLVGTDFSELSQKAIQEARRIAEKWQAKVHLLHVVELVDDADSRDPETEEFYSKMEAESGKKLEVERDSLGSCAGTCLTRIGPRHGTILEVADELQADLVFLGSEPMSPESKRLGVGHRVAITSARPVLLVPSD